MGRGKGKRNPRSSDRPRTNLSQAAHRDRKDLAGGPSSLNATFEGEGGASIEQTNEQREKDRKAWLESKKINKNFEEYYRVQKILDNDSPSEWPAFYEALRKELPTTFRVTGSRAHAQTLNQIIERTYVPLVSDVELDGVVQSPPVQMPWYPNHLAWQLSAPKRTIRKSPEFKVLQRFLVGETEIGNISRQEAVSMIPPLLLDVKSWHTCLDMCAAPGSKTAQIMEALATPTEGEEASKSSLGEGLLIANDSDYKRCHMLVHQTGRMPSTGLVVTNLDASQFPNIYLDDKQSVLQFDRILADVPCTGDGTMRKNVEIWDTWTPQNANSLHPLQVRILVRALQMLKPGGRMVYSTCSFNPVENEAVVAAGLNSFPSGQYKVVVQPEETVLPGLIRRKGLSEWKVASSNSDKSLNWHSSSEHYRGYLAGYKAVKSGKPLRGTESDDFKAGHKEGMDSTTDIKQKEFSENLWAPKNVKELELENCLRLLPHDQDTGGFFVCVIERRGAKLEEVDVTVAASGGGVKRAISPSAPDGPEDAESSKKARLDVKDEDEEEEIKEDDEDEEEERINQSNGPARGGKNGRGNGNGKKGGKEKKTSESRFQEDPFFYLKADDPEMATCVEHFGINSTFPLTHCFVRNQTGEANRHVYLSNQIVQKILTHNAYERIRCISAGIRVFRRQDTNDRLNEMACKWRIPSEGVEVVLPYMEEQGKIRTAGWEELLVFLVHSYPQTTQFSETYVAEVEQMTLGCHIVTFQAVENDHASMPLPLTMPVWKARDSLSLMIDKKEKSMLSLRVFGKDVTGENTGTKKDTLAAEAAQMKVDEAQDEEEEGNGKMVKEVGDVPMGEALGVAHAEEAGMKAEMKE